MRYPVNDGVIRTWILGAILLIVAYMQIDNMLDRAKSQSRIDQFMSAGGRFTSEDGERLRHRVQMVEHRLEILEDIERQEHRKK